MTTGAESRYNALGQYVEQEKGSKSLAQVARDGGISDVQLGRWLRNDMTRLPPTEILQAIASGLGRPLAAVQRYALLAAGQEPPVSSLNTEQLAVVAAMAGVDASWQRAVMDVVLRMLEEVARSDERLNGRG
jgi:transcriptional regulator with XRE-family HTH domain